LARAADQYDSIPHRCNKGYVDWYGIAAVLTMAIERHRVNWILVFALVAIMCVVVVVVRASSLSSLANPQTLVVLHGSYLTLDYTIDSIVDNVVLPNAPCKVLVVISSTRDLLSVTARKKLEPFLLDEFWMVDENFRSEQPSLSPLLSMTRVATQLKLIVCFAVVVFFGMAY
jgi:predicted nucleotidyltransferase